MAIDLIRGLSIRVTESELYVLEPTTVDLDDSIGHRVPKRVRSNVHRLSYTATCEQRPHVRFDSEFFYEPL